MTVLNSFKNQAKQYLEALHLLQHPFYRDWMEGKLTKSMLQDYASQYAHHVTAFPQYLREIHSQCPNEEARQILIENLRDEEGVTHGLPHPELWLRFGEGLGLSRAEIANAEVRDGIQNVVNTFQSLARSSYHEGLGALYAYESQVPEIADSKIEGLKAHYQIEDQRTLEFFQVHRTADVYHREALERVLDTLPEQEKAAALVASKKAAQALWDFLSEVHHGPVH